MSDGIVSQFPDMGSELSRVIIQCAIDVHRELGLGLLESVYESCLFYEMEKQALMVERQVILPVQYKGIKIEQGFRIDLMVNKKVVIEIKACDKIIPIHEAQIVTYMKLARFPLGLIINFNERLLKDGIKRFARTEFS